MTVSRLNVPSDIEWPVNFRQRLFGMIYGFRFQNNPLGQYAELELRQDDQTILRERLVYQSPYGHKSTRSPILVWPASPDGRDRRPTEKTIRDGDVLLLVIDR